jgi:hypothetical protein
MRAWLALIFLFALAPTRAHAEDWTLQGSGRLTLGGGAYVAEDGQDPWPLFELGLRGDLLFGEARPTQVLRSDVRSRTEDSRSMLAGALSVLFRSITASRHRGAGAGWGGDRRGATRARGRRSPSAGVLTASASTAGRSALRRRASQLGTDAREITIGTIDRAPLAIRSCSSELAEARDPDEPLEEDATY